MADGNDKLSYDISNLRLAKRYTHHERTLNTIDIRRYGDLIATTGRDECINVYNAASGLHINRIATKKYGVDRLRFGGQADDHAVTSSQNAWDHTIRLVSLTTNSYVRYFKGHRALVKAIEISPTEPDFFVSSGKDDWIRLWDFRTSGSQGSIEEEDCHIAFDPLGLVLAAATVNGVVELFDVRSMDAGPFKRWQLGGLPVDPPSWCSIEFSPNGQYILLSTYASEVYLVDSFSGARLFEWKDRTNSTGQPIPASFSPNSDRVITGSTDGTIHVYDTQTGLKTDVLCSHDSEAPILTRFHPNLPLVVSGGAHLNLWTTAENIPSISTGSEVFHQREMMDLS